MEKLFQIQHLKKYYPIGVKREKGKPEEVINLKAVDDVTFNIFKGENLGVVGESGCGKSTLGRCILKLIEPTEGDILFRDESVISKSKRQMVPLRKDMQMVFQNPYSSFNPKQTLKKALMDVAHFYGMNDEEAKKKIYELMDYVNMDKSLLSRRSGELSGGQLQRLAIVRALIASKPKDHPNQVKEHVALEGEVPNAAEIPEGCRFCTRCPEKIDGLCDTVFPPLYRVADRHWVTCHRAKEAAEKYAKKGR